VILLGHLGTGSEAGLPRTLMQWVSSMSESNKIPAERHRVPSPPHTSTVFKFVHIGLTGL
jgi:hypothetical protein